MNQTAGPRKGSKADRRIKMGFAGIALIIVAVLLVRQYYGRSLPYDYETDLPNALETALNENRRVLVVVYNRWGGPDYNHVVDMLAKPLNRDLFVKTRAIAVRVTPDAQGLDPYHVDSTPTLLWLAPDGELIAKRPGRVGEMELPDILNTPPVEIRSDAQAAMDEAQQQQRPVILIVEAGSQSATVQELLGQTLWRPEALDALAQMQPILIQVDAGNELAVGMDREDAPLVLRLSPAGRETARVESTTVTDDGRETRRIDPQAFLREILGVGGE